MFDFTPSAAADLSKGEQYALLAEQAASLLTGEPDRTAKAANFAALLFHGLADLNWLGFYFYDGSELRLIDWDDTGFGWHLYDFTTALVPHLGRDSFDPVLAAMVEGYRNHRPLPDEHLEILPFLLMARALSYVGWAHTRRQTAGDMVPVVIAISCELAQRLLASA